MSHTQKQVNTEIQAQQFMDRLRERKKGVAAYAAQILDPKTHKPTVIAPEELEAIYDFFLSKPGIEDQLANINPGEPTGLVFLYKDSENEGLARSAEIVMTMDGPELIIRTGNKLAGFAAAADKSAFKQKPGKKIEGAKKAFRFAVRVDDVKPHPKARLQIELPMKKTAFRTPKPMTATELREKQKLINKWNDIKFREKDFEGYLSAQSAQEQGEFNSVANLIYGTAEFYGEAKRIASIDPKGECKYLDHPSLGSVYVHGNTGRKENQRPTTAINIYSDLAIGNMDLFELEPDLNVIEDKRDEFKSQFSSDEDRNFIDDMKYAGDILQALEFMHAKNLLHLDVKPGNFLLDRDSDGKLYVKLSDFGTATFTHEESRLRDSQTGTRAFWGREDPDNPRNPFEVKWDKPDDMWAAGVSLYLLLTGDYPRFKPYIDIDIKAVLEDRPNPDDYVDGADNRTYQARLETYEKQQERLEKTGIPLLKEQAAYTQQVLAANPLLAGLLDLNRARRLTATAALQEFDKQGGKLHFVAKPPSLKDAEARAAQPNVNVETASDNSSVVVNANPGEAEPINTESLPPLPKRKQSMAAMIFSCFPQRQVQPFNQLRIDSLLKNIDTLHRVMEEAIATSAVTPGAKGRENESEVSVKAARSDYVEQTKSDFAELRQILNDHGPNIEPEEKRRINELIKEFDTLKPRRFSFRKS